MKTMHTMSWNAAAGALGIALVLIMGQGCDGSGGPSQEEAVLVPPGKADDFYSDTAQEFLVKGRTTIHVTPSPTMEADGTAMEEYVRQLADLKLQAIVTYLNYYVVDKSEHSSIEDYGGFHAMARAYSFKITGVSMEATDLYSFEFSGEIGATLEFLDLIPPADDATPPEGGAILRLGIPRFDEDDLNSRRWTYDYSVRPYRWNPTERSADEVEWLDLAVVPEEISSDAYIDYDALFADGRLTVGIHFGYDYNDEEYDVTEARQLFDFLKDRGFRAPVDTFEELRIDSPPFTKEIEADGRTITVEVKLVYARMVDPVKDARLLKEALIESLREREIIFFNGHAGFSGRLLPGNWMSTDEGIITTQEMWELDLPTFYQIFLANGCETYAKFADNFRLNPAKQDEDGKLKNMDVVTTTSFAWLSQMAEVDITILDALTGRYGTVNPSTWDGVLTAINYGVNSEVFFGVHGIDDNPRLHPFADPEAQCTPCRYNSDCGYPGNVCVTLGGAERVCTMTCLDDSACPDGMACMPVRVGSVIKYHQCIPASMTCEEPEEQDPPTLVINEILYDPAPDETGDANHDGVRSAVADEFVEIVNASDSDVEVSGYTISDSRDVRFTVPQGTVLGPWEVLLVFGGGDVDAYQWPSGVHVFASQGLFLNNSGDSVFLSDQDGNVIDSVTYDGSVEDRSITRATDGDPDSAMIPHPHEGMSPGTRQDGTPF